MRAPTKTSISTNLDQFLSTMIYSVRWHSFKISLIRISIFSVVAVPCRDQFKSFLLIRKLWKSFKIFLFDLNFWIMDQSAEFYWKIIQTTHHKIDIPLIFLHHFIQMFLEPCLLSTLYYLWLHSYPAFPCLWSNWYYQLFYLHL